MERDSQPDAQELRFADPRELRLAALAVRLWTGLGFQHNLPPPQEPGNSAEMAVQNRPHATAPAREVHEVHEVTPLGKYFVFSIKGERYRGSFSDLQKGADLPDSYAVLKPYDATVDMNKLIRIGKLDRAYKRGEKIRGRQSRNRRFG